jgi:hypothetical protein
MSHLRGHPFATAMSVGAEVAGACARGLAGLVTHVPGQGAFGLETFERPVRAF